ncbi:Putative FAD dependent oxidoreductase, D-amino acid oxidase, D-amino-acid oxidase [Septoria linicola]|uniref:FAD dependent oxidoreductase, D-amino acid oxidase, D-amino-acid oxidase n=1 Tax=Septoria linicola TaxID=215465 RepID=A0A9Q9AUB2_9PEZI|nr:putative FAD dependent oxidoreductase, D-amino acid oxidase, D-amino-acid oxidase [Septoria linicola]USW52137.1 Putative FAD dependent oxidoreductase, D-amino acid oxidase, D-amino-acid oxidase [Septoria linicola]
MASQSSQPSHVVIIGQANPGTSEDYLLISPSRAGVIGLMNAVHLAKAGHTITIIAAHVPGDESIEYTSPWAGAHWRTHATSSEPELCDWDVQTFQEWNKWLEAEARDSSLPKSGIKMQDSIHYWDGPITEDLWWAPHVEAYQDLPLTHPLVKSINDTRPSHAPEIQHAAYSRAHSLDAPGHLKFLESWAQRSGDVLIFKSRLPTDSGLPKALSTAEGISRVIGRGPVDIFINCTGLGAKQLCGDEALYPTKGQTALVRGEAKATRTRYHSGTIGKGDTSYCIPRPGTNTTILGGTKEVGNWSGEVDDDVTERTLERCGWMVPELLTGEGGRFEVLSVHCGLRPGRQGGPRVEREVVEGDGGRWKVVHAYGHAGAGYQNSVGCARKVVRLVEESLEGGKGSAKL